MIYSVFFYIPPTSDTFKFGPVLDLRTVNYFFFRKHLKIDLTMLVYIFYIIILDCTFNYIINMVLHYNIKIFDRSKVEKVQGLISTVRDFGYFFVNLIEYYYNICLYYITLILQKFIINISKYIFLYHLFI